MAQMVDLDLCNNPECLRGITAEFAHLGRLTIVTHMDKSTCRFHESCIREHLDQTGHCRCLAQVEDCRVIFHKIPPANERPGLGIESKLSSEEQSRESALVAFERKQPERALTGQAEDGNGTRTLREGISTIVDAVEDYQRAHAQITAQRSFSERFREFCANCNDPVVLHQLVFVLFYESALKLKNGPFKSGEDMATDGMMLLANIEKQYKEIISGKKLETSLGEYGKRFGVGVAKAGATVGIVLVGGAAVAAIGVVGQMALARSFQFSIQVIETLLLGAGLGGLTTAGILYELHEGLFKKIENFLRRQKLPYGRDNFFAQLKCKLEGNEFFQRLFEAKSTENFGSMEMELVKEFDRVQATLIKEIAKQAKANKKAR